MKTEYETKVLDVDIEYVEKELIELWAKIYDEVLMKRWVYDMTQKKWNKDLNLNAEWYRLRDNGKDITITYKKRSGNQIWDTQEIELEVSDFDIANELLSKLDRDNSFYQENRRKQFDLDWIEFTIDSWPMIPPYIEIESSSKEKVEEGLKLLWLENEPHWDFSVLKVYEKYGIDLHEFKKVVFEQ